MYKQINSLCILEIVDNAKKYQHEKIHTFLPFAFEH